MPINSSNSEQTQFNKISLTDDLNLKHVKDKDASGAYFTKDGLKSRLVSIVPTELNLLLSKTKTIGSDKILKNLHNYRITRLNKIHNHTLSKVTKKIEELKENINTNLTFEVNSSDKKHQNFLENVILNTGMSDKLEEELRNEFPTNSKIADQVRKQVSNKKMKTVAQEDAFATLNIFIKQADTPKQLKYLCDFIDFTAKNNTLGVNGRVDAEKSLTIALKKQLSLELAKTSEELKGGYFKNISNIHSLVAILKDRKIEIPKQMRKKIIESSLDSVKNYFKEVEKIINKDNASYFKQQGNTAGKDMIEPMIDLLAQNKQYSLQKLDISYNSFVRMTNSYIFTPPINLKQPKLDSNESSI